MKKPSCSAKRGERREKREIFLEKSPEIRVRMRKDEKKVGFAGRKKSEIPQKSPENESKTGKSGKNGDFGTKKGGVGERRKNGLYCRFCNAMRWQNGCK